MKTKKEPTVEFMVLKTISSKCRRNKKCIIKNWTLETAHPKHQLSGLRLFRDIAGRSFMGRDPYSFSKKDNEYTLSERFVNFCKDTFAIKKKETKTSKYSVEVKFNL